MVGGVLVERTVKDVVPALVNNRQLISDKKLSNIKKNNVQKVPKHEPWRTPRGLFIDFSNTQYIILMLIAY